MTTPTNDSPRELLAAYVDGELDPASCTAVERWLADHPDALREVQAQRELSPANASFWERASPPEPPETEWVVVRHEIEHRLAAPVGARRSRGNVWTLAGLTAAGVAAAVAWVAFGPVKPPAPRDPGPSREVAQTLPAAPAPRRVAGSDSPRSDDPLTGFATLPIATDEDVVLDRVPDFPAGWLPVGRHPLEGVMALATQEELLVSEFAPSPAWPMGAPKMIPTPGDAPMIYAARLR